MKAMLLRHIASLKDNPNPLELTEVPMPVPEFGEVLVQVNTCGVCHTEIDEIEGRATPPILPVIPGHQVAGIIVQLGEGVQQCKIGDRVGIAWIWKACGTCSFCLSNQENLCEHFVATGKDVNGGYAEYIKVPAAFTIPLPSNLSDKYVSPMLCAGAIGYRSLRLSNLVDGSNLGLTGFGASAHLLMKIVKHKFPYVKVYVYARQVEERNFALELGAKWAGDTGETAPEKMDCIIDTTPVWKPIIEALRELKKGGRLVINAIRKEDYDKELLSGLSYQEQLWNEKEIKTVANVTRDDVKEFLEIASTISLKPEVREYPLESANLALLEIKQQKIRGAKVLKIR
jgi:alcohol dehydrogenase, propanol-preferring